MMYKLESIRGIAACVIILFHSPVNFSDIPVDLVKNSYLFVDLFFVLSGYIMATAYTDRIINGMSLYHYILRRLGRIYPLHFFMLFIWLPYILLKHQYGKSGLETIEHTNNLFSFLSNILLIQSMGVHNYLSWNTPSWSISTEFFTYITFYFICIISANRASLLLPIVISVLSYCVIIYLDRDSLDITYDYGFFRCMGAFYLGVTTYRCTFLLSLQQWRARHVKSLEVFISTLTATSLFFAHHHQFSFVIILSLFSLCIWVFSEEESGIVGKLLLLKPFKKVGVWSYSIYMTHYIVLIGIMNISEYIFHYNLETVKGYPTLFLNVIFITSTILISSFTYRYIESFFRDQINLLINKRSPYIPHYP